MAPYDNYNRTKLRNVRIPEQTWQVAGQKARAEGITLSEAIRQLLEGYIAGEFEL